MPPTKPHILCVDDDSDTCAVLTRLLRDEDYEAEAVESAEQALELVSSKEFSLYILDTLFYREGGTRLCRRIRELSPQTPIIFFSGVVMDSYKQLALSAGANAFIPKPEIDKLLETVHSLLNSSVSRSIALL